MKSLLYVMGGMILILVIVSILGPIASSVNASTITGYPRTLLRMVPLFISLGAVGIGLSMVFHQLQDVGLIKRIDDDVEGSAA